VNLIHEINGMIAMKDITEFQDMISYRVTYSLHTAYAVEY